MENNIELFERYINDQLTTDEKITFRQRLKTDKKFLSEFRIYLFTLNGIYREAEQNNVEFGLAMKNISEEELLRIIGRKRTSGILRSGYLRERILWPVSIAAVLAIGFFSVLRVHQSDMDRLDNTIVAYNYIPESNRSSWESLSVRDIPSLEEQYHNTPEDDVQSKQEAGLRLAMAYLKIHDRKKTKEILTELSTRFADDEDFVAQCQRILNQLK
ncbi:MAG: hypothetical protein K2H47_06560 [Muribaculaceae bacterium]|nr:hypothetical protein [Muribaculaceae bacterium]